ncbi:hypothetical protein AVEN_154512-1 [Araneus ventricosus]|uniref:Uncharacterized protein n=1 Tax=Araneus ventricosus TaxID=182803 RepID=A0A4Y2HXB5_ARAVE|nr:hypothetical protein AVEN_154512-1 [Araneus ventricosus]
MLAERSHTSAAFYPHRKSPLESDQVNAKATLGNHHTRLFVHRIPPPGTASLMMFCAQALRHVGTIRSGAENKQMCILRVLFLALMTIRKQKYHFTVEDFIPEDTSERTKNIISVNIFLSDRDVTVITHNRLYGVTLGFIQQHWRSDGLLVGHLSLDTCGHHRENLQQIHLFSEEDLAEDKSSFESRPPSKEDEC